MSATVLFCLLHVIDCIMADKRRVLTDVGVLLQFNSFFPSTLATITVYSELESDSLLLWERKCCIRETTRDCDDILTTVLENIDRKNWSVDNDIEKD